MRSINGEHFFIARSGANRVRLGVHLDVTEYKDSHSLSISWTLTNEHGDTAVEEMRPPVRVKMEDSHSNNGKTFTDYVEYQWLRLAPKTLNVDIEIEKCPLRDCDTGEGQRLRKVYAFKLCQTSL